MTYKNWITFLPFFTIYACALLTNKLANICFYFLIVYSIATLLFKKNAVADFCSACKRYWPIHLAMSTTIITIFIRQVSEGTFTINLYDTPSRLALFVLLFWIARQLPVAMIKKIKWGFIFGAIFYAISIWLESDGGDIRLVTIHSFPVIFSSELALLMGVFSIFSIGWEKSTNKAVFVMSLLAGSCGLYSVYLSQARGAWLAIPLFILLMVVALRRSWQTRTQIMVFILILVALFGALSTTPIVQERIERGKQDLIEFSEQKNLDTSLGTRLQLWNASWILFKENPVFGVGIEHFREQLHLLSEQGIITKEAALFHHSHNELLYSMATLGSIGLIAMLLIYFVPAGYFIKYLSHADDQIRITATMGLSLCFGYVIFGLVDVMFFWRMCNTFYSISIALFLAYITKRNEQLLTG